MCGGWKDEYAKILAMRENENEHENNLPGETVQPERAEGYL
jgi:hypothetical protein